MRRAFLPILLLLLVLATPSHAIREKAAMGVWTWRNGEAEVDTIRLKKQHIFDRQIFRYEPVEVEDGSGAKRTVMKLTGRTLDKGRWYIVDKRVRLHYNREVDGEAVIRTVDGEEMPHAAFLGSQGGKLVLEEVNEEALPSDAQRAFEKKTQESAPGKK